MSGVAEFIFTKKPENSVFWKVLSHMRCRGCQEEIFGEELISGRCPLCGYQVTEDVLPSPEPIIVMQAEQSNMYEEDVEPYGEVVGDFLGDLFSGLERSMFISHLARDIHDTTGVPYNMCKRIARQVVDDERSNFQFQVPSSLREQMLLKKCSVCGRLHFRLGSMIVSGSIVDGIGEYEINYRCPRCT